MYMSVYLSPMELWQDFDQSLTNPEINIVREYTEGDLTTRELYFTAWRTPAGSVRVFARFCFNHRLLNERFYGRAPVAVIMGGLRTGKSDEIHDYILAELEGVSTFTFDYYGVTPDKPRYTLYPDDLKFANFYLNYIGKESALGLVKSDPKNTAWYIWTALARKSITMLGSFDEVNPDRIGILGVKTGGKLAWILSAVDSRVRAAVTLFNCGWQGYEQLYNRNKSSGTIELNEERAVYLASLSTQSYAPFVKAPLLALISTNDYEKTFDRSFDTFTRVPEELDAVLAVEVHTNKEIPFADRSLIRVWLAKYLLSEDITIPSPPKIKLRASGGKLYIDIIGDLSEDIKSVTVYQSNETSDPADRNWTVIPHDSVGDGEYLAVGKVIDTSEYFFCFATVTYNTQLKASSNLAAVIPDKLGITVPNLKASRLLFDITTGASGFAVINSGELFRTGEEIAVSKGPLNLSGVQALRGDLATYRPSDPAFKAYDDDRLQVGFFSPRAQSVTIMAREHTDNTYTAYYCTVSAVGGELWDKMTLPPQEFKSNDNTALESFENVVLLSFAASDVLLVNSILWV